MLLIFCLFNFTKKGCSQAINPYLSKWGFSVGLGVNNNSVIDHKFSSLPYSGNGNGASASISYQSKILQQQVNVSYTSATLKNRFENSLNTTNLIGNYTGLFLLYNSNYKFNFLAGPQISMLYTTRKYDGFLNNNSTFEFATSLGAALELNYKFKKIGIIVKNRVSSPLFSYVQQPAYGFETFFLQTNNSLKNTSDFLSFNSFSRITNCLIIDKKIAKQHHVSLNYQIDFYKINKPMPVKSNINSLTLTYGYLL